MSTATGAEPTLIELLEQCAGDEETFSAFAAGLQQDTSDAASLRSQRLRAAAARLREEMDALEAIKAPTYGDALRMELLYRINGGPGSPVPPK